MSIFKWRLLSLVSAGALVPGPAGLGRLEHAAGWLGNSIIIWGGYSGNNRAGINTGIIIL